MKFDNQSDEKSAQQTRIVYAVLFTGLAGALILAIAKINREVMMTLAAVFTVAILLSRLGYIRLARWAALLAALTLVAFLAFKNYGIRDTAMPGMFVILIAAGLLAGRKGTLIIGGLILLIVIAIGLLENTGTLVNRFSNETFFADYLTMVIIVAAITGLQWMTINRLNLTIEKNEREIDEREKTETMLAEAESRYRSLVEKIPAVIYISEPGESGKWHYVSPQITEMTGYTQEEWLANPDLWYQLIHPDDRLHAVSVETEMLKKGEMPATEYRLKKRDGRYIWVFDKSLKSMGENILQGFLLDISAQKTAEAELQKRLAELNTVREVSKTLADQSDLANLIEETGEQIRITFNSNVLFIALLDEGTNLIHFPYYYRYQRMPDETIRYGEGLTSYVMRARKAVVINERWMERARELGMLFDQNGLTAKSTLAVPVLTSNKELGAIMLHDSAKEHAFSENDVRLLSTIAANLALAVEKTRLQQSIQKELELQEKLVRELETKNAELERFTYTASHDLKSPLITIRGYLGYLEKDAKNGDFERFKKDIQRIVEATDKMHNLLADLLDLSRLGRLVNEFEDVPFEELAQEAIRRVEGQILENQVQVKIGGGLPVVHVDKERMIEALQNLIDNACKFTKGKGQPLIEIGAQTRDDTHIFYVRDNGLGIQPEYHKKIFELFNKLDPNSEGTGVGLTLVKRIIELHNGNIWVDSKEGAGATFYFTLGDPQNHP